MSAQEFGAAATAEVLTRGFEDYAVPMVYTPERLLQVTSVDSVDLAATQVLFEMGKPLGAALIARRGKTSRLAGMSLVREARGRGMGGALIEQIKEDARQRNDDAVLLEVLEGNLPAVRLYRRRGFTLIRRLVSFSAAPVIDPVKRLPLTETPLSEVAQGIAESGVDHVPWQVSSQTVAQLSATHLGFRLGGACLAILRSTDVAIRIRTVGVEGGISKNGKAVSKLLQCLRDANPGRSCEITAFWPEEHSELFSRAGFVRSSLSQLQMILSLSGN